jgi:transposase
MVEEDMPSATASLPSDPQALRVLAASLQEALAAKERELAARDAEIYAKTLHIEKLRATLALMKRARFGRSSERIEQLELLIGDLEEEAAEQQARPRRRGAAPLPEWRASPPWPSAVARPPAARAGRA